MADSDWTVAELVEDYEAGRVGRRDFVRLLLSVGIGMPSITTILAACGSSKNNTAANTGSTKSTQVAAPSAAAAAGGSATAAAAAAGTSATAAVAAKAPTGQVVILQGADVNFLDPEFRNSVPEVTVTFHIFDTFLWRDAKTLKPVPWIIESWKTLDDTTWEFKVKTGAKFHDGTDVNAEAVAFSLERHSKLKIGGQDTKVSFGRLTNFDSAKAVDATTVQMKTKTPTAPDFLLDQLTAYEVMPPSVYKDESDANLKKIAGNATGSGPYKFVEWVKDDHVTLQAFDGYWGKKAAFAKLIIKPVAQLETRVLALQKGEADLIVNIPPDQVDDVKKFANVSSVQGGRDIFVGMRCDHKPLDDKRVRQAISYAFNFDAVNKGLLNGGGQRSKTLINPPHEPPDAKAYTFDQAKAKQLLADAGLPNGFSVTMDAPNGRYIKDKEIAQAFVSDMSKVGIKVDLKVLDWALYAGDLLQKRQPDDLFFLGLGSSFTGQDELFYLHPDFSLNSTYWQNADWVALYDKLKQELDSAKRQQLMNQMWAIAQDDAPMVYIWHQVDNYGYSKKINWEARADERILLHDATPKA